MSNELTGTVEGSVIRLDGPAGELNGQRVRIRLERLDQAAELTPEEQRRLLREWAARGPQGPLEGSSGWPDENL